MTAAPPRPSATAPRSYRFPRFERRTLSNGIGLVVAPVNKLPVASIIAVIDAGAALDPAGKEGLALLTVRALVEGAAGLTERAERLGTELDADADWDTALLNLTVLSERV
ncbi:MAG TPA: hypothetical protein VK679_20190, partial [Gemmatimonadaceae bacterium]|nr:hypothetical protein [Gemmatimonadaceae bacterium]